MPAQDIDTLEKVIEPKNWRVSQQINQVPENKKNVTYED